LKALQEANMNYVTFKGLKLSALGYGAMRLPTKDGAIDTETADAIVKRAYDSGINYFDTAYGYHAGESERFIGKSLSRFPRDSWYLASKFPGYEKRNACRPAEIFEEQIQKCGVNYFDFYMLHNVCEYTLNNYFNEDFGVEKYLVEQKKAGRIKHLGFSVHARTDAFMQFLDRFGDDMEFCQIQLNALDWTLQDAKLKHEALTQRGIPIWVMEPVRGGQLASFSEEKEAKLKAARTDDSIAAWTFRWLQTLPNIGVILSGMTTMEQLEDNLKTFGESKPLNPEEVALYTGIVSGLAELLPCTGCRYCCPGCPKNLDIPKFLALYNDCHFTPSLVAKMVIDAMKPSQRPSACISCGKCTEICPQGINIPEVLKELVEIVAGIKGFVAPIGEDD
jgi:predicted aldo/keto reductase-like oxidoreductase